MPNLSSETIQQTIYDGPISMAHAIYLGIALLVLFTVTLYIEKKHSGRNIVALFWVLRLGALAGLLWMLLGPSEQTVTKFKTLKSIAVVADVSQSMQTVDALDTTGDQRWRLTQQTELNNSELVSLDHLHLNISQLKRHYLSLMEMLEQSENSQAMLDKLHRIQQITERALSHANSLENQLSLSGKADFVDMSTELENDLLAEFNQLEDELSDSEEIISLNRFNQMAKLEPLLEKHLQQTRFYLRNNLTETENNQPELANHSRIDKVRSSLVNAEESWLKQLSEQIKVKRYTFDSNIYALKKGQWDLATDTNSEPSSTSLDDQEQLASTDMTAVLDLINEEAAKDSVEAVILLTDGKQTAIGGRSMIQAASALGSLPVYPVPVGSSKRLRDVVLHYPNAPAAVMKDDTISIETMIDTFDCEGEILSVQLKKDNIVLDQQSIDVLSARSHHRVTFVAPEQDYGRHEFQVEVLPVAEEERTNNNSAQVTVDVVVDEFHILLADETWRWEYRYLVNLFERDPKITFDHLVYQPNLIATGKLNNRKSLPETVEEWSQYRVIVLGDLSPQNFSLAAQNSLKEYITRRGGNLILIAGTENMPSRYLNGPLVDLLPIEPSPVSVDNQQGYFWQLTGEGRTSTATQLLADQSASERVWQTASMTMPVYSLSQFCEPKSTTHTLISAVSKRNQSNNLAAGDQLPAFLCWHFAGKGSVTYLSAPSTYHLRSRKGDLYHHHFWGQLLRSVVAHDLSSGSQYVKIQTEKVNYSAGEEVTVFVNLKDLKSKPVEDAQFSVVALHNDTLATQIEMKPDASTPGRYIGQLRGLSGGDYALTPRGDIVQELLTQEGYSGAVELPLHVEADMLAELVDTRCDLAALQQLAEITGGQVIPPTSMSEVGYISDLEPVVTEEVKTLPLWPRWGLLLLICGFLCTEWGIRKWVGLA